MPFAKPDKPTKIRSMNATMTITTPEFGTLSNSGMPKRTVGSNETNVPCRLNTVTPAEALKYGHIVNETAYRVLCPVRAPDGDDIRIKKNDYVTIDSVKYAPLGPGKPEGDSGWQTVVLKREDR